MVITTEEKKQSVADFNFFYFGVELFLPWRCTCLFSIELEACKVRTRSKDKNHWLRTSVFISESGYVIDHDPVMIYDTAIMFSLRHN